MIDAKRTVAATPADWKALDYPETGDPGASGRYTADHFAFACPGCGRWGCIRVGHPKPGESPSWDVVSGDPGDPATLTLSPSIHCVGCCGWHGYLRSGIYASV